MSGGSYQYASEARDLDEVLAKAGGLRAIADRLDATGGEDAAADLLGVLDYVALTSARVAARMDRLHQLLHLVEWTDSGDTGEEQVALALMRYRGTPVLHLAAPAGSTAQHRGAATICHLGGTREPLAANETVVYTAEEATCPGCAWWLTLLRRPAS